MAGVRARDRDKADIEAYVAAQVGEEVVHLEKVASEMVGPTRHEIWDVHCTDSRWWVVTNPTNLYRQEDFKSRDVVLTFHIGLSLRVHYLSDRDVPVAPEAAVLLPGSWRRWQQAFESYERADEAEHFQAVGMHLRECLISFADETRSDELVPEGAVTPKAADFVSWAELLANALGAGKSSARLRSYLKALVGETWQYVNWLTHAKNARRADAEIALKAVEHLLGMFTAARLRAERRPARCQECGSYEVLAGECRHCGWLDAGFEPSKAAVVSDEEVARRLAEPCTPSSDISTFLTPDDYR